MFGHSNMKSIILLSIVFMCACIVALSVAKEIKAVSELPSDIPTCSEKDANLNECLKTSFQQMTLRMKDGIEELNIQPLDPFVLEKSTYDYSNSIVTGRIGLRNVRIYGMSEAIIDKVNFELNDGKLRMEVASHIPNMVIEGNYKASVVVNNMKISPKGYFNVTMTNVVMKSKPEGELYEHDGHSYLRLTKFNVDPKVDDMKIYATGIFPDPNLNAIILDFANQYWRQIYEALLPETRSTWEPLMVRRSNEFFAAVPFDLFLTKN